MRKHSHTIGLLHSIKRRQGLADTFITQGVMKVSSIGPFTGPQITDIDREDEVEGAELTNSDSSPIKETHAEAETSDEQQSQDGVVHLMEFLNRRREKQKRMAGVAQSPTDKALAAYERQISGDIQYRGRNLNRKF